MITTMRTWLLAVCVLALCSGIAWASNPRWTDNDLVGFSSAIVTGRVTDVSAGRDLRTNGIYTYVTLLIDQVLKGDVTERQIVIKQGGGDLDGEGLRIAEQAIFGRGENVLVFLETRPRDGTLYTSALWQGKWLIDRDAASGEPIATRQPPIGDTRGVLRGDIERRTLSTFMDRIRAAAGPSAVRDFVGAPPEEELRAAVHTRDNVASAPYAFLGPYRWNEFDSGATIPVIIAGAQPGLADGGVSGIQRATSVWSNPTGLRYGAGSGAGRCENTSSSAGNIAIVFNDPCAELSNSGGILAEGGAYYTSSGGKTIGGTFFSRAVSGFIVNNDGSTAAQFLQNANCFASVDTHELGHVMGLDHSSDPSAIMYAFLSFGSCSGAPIPPSADDIAGIRAIYPPTGTTTSPPGPPTGLTATAVGSTVTLTWGAPATGGAPTAYIIEAGSAPGLANLANFSTGNTATTFSASGVGAGSYYVRVRATNSAGTSAPSADALLVVGGGCVGPPSAPTGFANTFKSGGTVTFAWNASAGATTYIIEAGSAPGAANLANADLGSSATSATFSGVPNGTYFVRLRAQNACGTSGVSNEVVLILP